jgi:dienelactone hydrolase
VSQRRRCASLFSSFVLWAAAATLLAPASARPSDDFEAQAALFQYDRKVPLDVKEVGRETRDGGVVVRDITFAAVPGREPNKAYVVAPPGAGPFAGVLWLHWLGEPETTNRSQFLKESVGLASLGAVSVLVDAMWSAPEWYENRVPEQDYDNSIRQVIAIRRALDLLLSQPQVDAARVGLVGHDYGGMYGMLASGADPRAKTYVFIATAASLNDWAFFARQPASKAAYLRQNAVLELTDSLRRIRNASTLFQFATNDAYVSRSDTAVLLGASNDRKERRFYDADHGMAVPKAAQDRDAWLAVELGLGRPAAPGP